MDSLTALKEQLDAVSVSSYPPSMLNLARAVENCTPREIRIAMDAYGTCKIKALAQNIMDALEYDSFAVVVLEKLCLVRRVRNAVFEKSPGILDMLLKHSCSNQKAFERYQPAIISLLAHPFPPPFLLPTSLTDFLNHLTTSLSRSPSLPTLGALYSLLTSHPDQISPLLQHRTIHTILSKTLVQADQEIKFLTIAILARLSQCTPSESQEDPQSLFEGTKGSKVVKLAVSICLSAVSAGDAELVKLCAVAVEAVEKELLEEWAVQKGSAALLGRVKEKAEGELEGDILEAYFMFLSALSSGVSVELGMEGLMKRVVRKLLQGHGGHGGWSEEFIERVAGTIQKSSTPSLFPLYLEIIESNFTNLSSSPHLPKLLCSILTLATTIPPFIAELSSKFAENEFSTTVHTFLTSSSLPSPPSQCTLSSPNCPRQTHQIYLQNSLSLCQFILQLSFLPDSFLESSLLNLSLQKLSHFSSLSSPCTKTSQDVKFPALVEELATPDERLSSHNWKRSLINDLLTDTQAKYSMIINSVGHVCRDLESRCQTVELPLRTAESEILSLREQIASLTHERMKLEEELQCVKTESEEGRREREGLVFELKCVRGEIVGLRGEMREEREQWEGIVEKGRTEMKEREEELLTTNRILDDELRETQQRVEELMRKIDEMEKEKMEAEEALLALREKLDVEGKELSYHIQELQEEYCKLKTTSDNNLKEARSRLTEKEHELGTLQGTIQQMSLTNTSLRDQITTLETQHRQSLDRAIEETELKLQTLRNEYDTTLVDIHQKHSMTESDLQKSTETTHRLTRQISRLKKINEDQRNEMIRMVEAHDRLQRAAAEMNSLRFKTIGSDVDGLSQALSQLAAGETEESPVGHRTKRRRGETTARTRSSLSIEETPTSEKTRSKSVETPRGAVMRSHEAEASVWVEKELPPAKGELQIQSLETPIRDKSLRTRSAKRGLQTPVVKDTPRIPLSSLRSRINMAIPSGSVTQDEEEGEYMPLKKGVTHGTQFTDLLGDEDGFSQFDI